MGQFIHPFALSIVQLFLQPSHDNFVGRLGLPIPLRIDGCRIPIPNPQLPAISLEGFTVKLETVIRDQRVWHPKLGDNIILEEFLGIHVLDIGVGLSFHPFGKVVRADEELSSVPYGLRKGSYYIQAPLSEWPGAR